MIKEPQSDVEKNDYNNNIKKQTPTATRHLLLVRHGQYNLLGATDEQCKLTELGMNIKKLVLIKECLVSIYDE